MLNWLRYAINDLKVMWYSKLVLPPSGSLPVFLGRRSLGMRLDIHVCLARNSLLTSFQGSGDHTWDWSTSLIVTGKDGAVVGGSWCEPSQCEGVCCCILLGNPVPPTNLRDTGERVASDHLITQGRHRRGPSECHVPCCALSDCDTLWLTSWG